MTIDSICEKLTSLMRTVRKPLRAIPAALIVCGAINRPGLSAIEVASNIIRRQAEAGRYFGALRDGSENPEEAMERIRVEEIFKAVMQMAKVEVGIPIGGIQFQGTAVGNVVTGFNINPVHGDGIVR